MPSVDTSYRPSYPTAPAIIQDDGTATLEYGDKLYQVRLFDSRNKTIDYHNITDAQRKEITQLMFKILEAQLGQDAINPNQLKDLAIDSKGIHLRETHTDYEYAKDSGLYYENLRKILEPLEEQPPPSTIEHHYYDSREHTKKRELEVELQPTEEPAIQFEDISSNGEKLEFELEELEEEQETETDLRQTTISLRPQSDDLSGVSTNLIPYDDLTRVSTNLSPYYEPLQEASVSPHTIGSDDSSAVSLQPLKRSKRRKGHTHTNRKEIKRLEAEIKKLRKAIAGLHPSTLASSSMPHFPMDPDAISHHLNQMSEHYQALFQRQENAYREGMEHLQGIIEEQRKALAALTQTPANSDMGAWGDLIGQGQQQQQLMLNFIAELQATIQRLEAELNALRGQYREGPVSTPDIQPFLEQLTKMQTQLQEQLERDRQAFLKAQEDLAAVLRLLSERINSLPSTDISSDLLSGWQRQLQIAMERQTALTTEVKELSTENAYLSGLATGTDFQASMTARINELGQALFRIDTTNQELREELARLRALLAERESWESHGSLPSSSGALLPSDRRPSSQPTPKLPSASPLPSTSSSTSTSTAPTGPITEAESFLVDLFRQERNLTSPLVFSMEGLHVSEDRVFINETFLEQLRDAIPTIARFLDRLRGRITNPPQVFSVASLNHVTDSKDSPLPHSIKVDESFLRRLAEQVFGLDETTINSLVAQAKTRQRSQPAFKRPTGPG